MNRRNVLIALSFAAIVVCIAAAARFLNPGSSGSESVTVDVAAPGATPERALLKFDGAGDRLPVYLVRDGSGDVLALVGRDPHSGCDVEWLPDYDAESLGEPGPGAFKAKCSGWVFSRDGRVLFGAAARGLERVPVTLKDRGTMAELDLSRFILGLCRESGQAGCSPPGSPQFVSTLPLPVVRPRP